MFRVQHWDRSGSMFSYFSTGNVNPAVIWDAWEDEYSNAYFRPAFRCDPQSTNYFCDENYALDANSRGYFVDESGDPVTGWGPDPGETDIDSSLLGVFDTNWHQVIFHVSLNSVVNTKDGIMNAWYDGFKVSGLTDVAYIGTSGDINAGYNMVAFGGNAYNNWLGITNGVYQAGAEQWYAIDDIVVATTYEEAVAGPVTTTTCYLDADGDLYSDGTSETGVETCSENYYEAGDLTATSGDCNDSDAAINPGATEICGNSIDDNCNSQIDEGCGTEVTTVLNFGTTQTIQTTGTARVIN